MHADSANSLQYSISVRSMWAPMATADCELPFADVVCLCKGTKFMGGLCRSKLIVNQISQQWRAV